MIIDNFYRNFKVRDYMEDDNNSYLVTNEHIDCSLGTNPFIDEKIIKKYTKDIEFEFNKYPSHCYTKLKKALVEFWNNKLNLSLSIEEIGFGSGTMGIIRNLCSFLIDKGDYVLGCAPQFPRFISEVELRKSNYEYYCLDKNNNFKFKAEDFIKKINSKYMMIHLENPNNPTGQIIDIKDIEKIVKVAQKYNIVVLVDEAYGEYMNLKNSSINLIKKYNNLVVLRSASKFWGYPNYRLGYVFANKEILKVYNMIALPFPFTDYACNVFEKTLNDYEYLKETNEMVKNAKRDILEALNKENYLHTDLETPIFTVTSSKYKNLYEELLKNGIISEPCSIFLNLNEQFARIRITKNNKKLIKILQKILF